MKYYIDVKEYAHEDRNGDHIENVVSTVGPFLSAKERDKAEEGMQYNLDHDHYFTAARDE